MRFPTLAALLLCVPHPASADRIDDYVREQMRALRLPGLALAIVHDGKIESIRTYGMANLELGVPVTRDTVFEIGSVTKQFTSAAVMMLAADGKLRLDDPVAAHLPGAPQAWHGITIRHLLTHSSGLREYLSIEGLPDQAHALDHREMTALFMRRIPQEFQPGETWAYSNTGYLLLGDIVEQAARQPYWEVLRTRIFEPAGMRATRSSRPRDIIRGRASGYGWSGEAFENRPALSENAYSAGAIASTITDMSAWALALDRRLVLSQALLDQVWTPLTVANGQVPPVSYGFGWCVDRERGRRVVLHSGGTPGLSSAIRHHPDDRLTVIVLANHGDRLIDQMPLEIAGIVEPALARRNDRDPDPRMSSRLEQSLRGFMAGRAHPAEFTAAMRTFLSTASGRGLGEWIASHGELKRFQYAQAERIGRNRVLRYRATVGEAALWFSFTLTEAGEIAQITWW